MKHLKSIGKYDTQLLAELSLASDMKDEVNNKFFDMWKRMLKKDFDIDLAQTTLPQLKKELMVEIGDVYVIFTGIGASTYKIRVLKPTYTLVTFAGLSVQNISSL